MDQHAMSTDKSNIFPSADVIFSCHAQWTKDKTKAGKYKKKTTTKFMYYSRASDGKDGHWF